MLAESLSLLQSFVSKDMDEKTKCYRQAVFKLDHMERKKGEDFAFVFLTATSVALSRGMHLEVKLCIVSLCCDHVHHLRMYSLLPSTCVCLRIVTISTIHKPSHNPKSVQKT